MTRSAYIYFIKPVGLDGPIKIGCSGIPEDRLVSLAAWSPFPLEVIGKTPGTLKDEGFLHRCFSEYHSHHEWFYFTPALGEIITKILASSIDEVRGSLILGKSIRKPRAKRPERTESQKLEALFVKRIKATQKRLRIANYHGAWYNPRDVAGIMSRWSGNSYRQIKAIHPTDAEITRLEEYLSAPEIHSISFSATFHTSRNKDSICIPIFELEDAA